MYYSQNTINNLKQKAQKNNQQEKIKLTRTEEIQNNNKQTRIKQNKNTKNRRTKEKQEDTKENEHMILKIPEASLVVPRLLEIAKQIPLKIK